MYSIFIVAASSIALAQAVLTADEWTTHQECVKRYGSRFSNAKIESYEVELLTGSMLPVHGFKVTSRPTYKYSCIKIKPGVPDGRGHEKGNFEFIVGKRNSKGQAFFEYSTCPAGYTAQPVALENSPTGSKIGVCKKDEQLIEHSKNCCAISDEAPERISATGYVLLDQTMTVEGGWSCMDTKM